MFKLMDRVARNASTTDESAPDDHLILDLTTGRYYAAGEVGGFIWQRLDGKRSLDSIAKEIATSFDVDLEQGSADLLEFVERMVELGLAHRVTS